MHRSASLLSHCQNGFSRYALPHRHAHASGLICRCVEQVDDNAEGITKMIVAAKQESGAEVCATMLSVPDDYYLPDARRLVAQVSEQEGRTFAAEHDCLFFTTSSMLGSGVLPAFKVSAYSSKSVSFAPHCSP